jgi:anaphase-promoting complex subunit 5
MSGDRRPSEASLPLHLALAWILLNLFPFRASNDEPSPYSPSFTAEILQIVCREVLEVCS